MSNDETFQQYREKLTETIARKEGMIRDINRQKSKEENERNCRNTLERVNRDSGNVAAAIETYASVPLN